MKGINEIVKDNAKSGQQCPKCGSHQLMAKKTTQTKWCRRCLHEWPINEVKQ